MAEMSNQDLGLGPDFSEVELFVQEDPFRMLACYMTIAENFLERKMLDAICKDDEQVISILQTNLTEGF